MPKRPKVESPRQQNLFELEKPPEPASRPFSLASIFLGTSSFTAAGWEGSFYPLGMRQGDFLRHYADQFRTVEIDSTFYGTPSLLTVASWRERRANSALLSSAFCLLPSAFRFPFERRRRVCPESGRTVREPA